MYKKIILSIFILWKFNYISFAQKPYWQQTLKYNINATLDYENKIIKGVETIIYKNNSPDTLRFIWMHIYPNAYKSRNTAFSQQIKNDPHKKQFMSKIGKGEMSDLAFKIDGNLAKIEPYKNINFIDIIKLVLNKPLNPGEEIIISTPFVTKLPPYFSRSGYSKSEIMACQWYPKPAVYDSKGWHEMPYLDSGEFYSEFATFDVNLTVPSELVISATGNLKTESELIEYKRLGYLNSKYKDKSPFMYEPLVYSPQKQLLYHAENVVDFAWFADKDFVIQYDTAILKSKKSIDIFTYYHKKKRSLWKNSIIYAKNSLKKYSEWVGEYAYPVVQVVEGPKNNSSGGMEYPMVTLITVPNAVEERLDGVIAHEIGHNWFMAILANNERDHTWMDEGINTYYQFKYEAEFHRSNSLFGSKIPEQVRLLSVDEFLESVYNNIAEISNLQSIIDIPADKFEDRRDYALTSYIKAAYWLRIFEINYGREALDKAMKFYYTKWKFKHPEPEDMQKAFEEALNLDLSKFFGLTKKAGRFSAFEFNLLRK